MYYYNDFEIDNYYGGLAVKNDDDVFYWGIYNVDGEYGWKPIPSYLYDSLVRWHGELEKTRNAQNES